MLLVKHECKVLSIPACGYLTLHCSTNKLQHLSLRNEFKSSCTSDFKVSQTVQQLEGPHFLQLKCSNASKKPMDEELFPLITGFLLL